MNTGSFAVDISKHRGDRATRRADVVAVEEPLEIRLGYSTPDGRASRSISITMRTPGDDAALAAGFLTTESIINAADDIASIDVCGPPAPDSGNHNVIRVELKASVEVDLGRLQRHFYTTSSCGVCGKTSLDALKVVGQQAMSGHTPVFSKSMLVKLPERLREAQATFEETGGLHAAAAFDVEGKFVSIMEDVGRHNAVDKVVGQLLTDGRLPASNLGIIVSGRASFELMQKTLVAGIPMLVAVSAPSSLAVRLAKEFNMTLVGFLRGDTFNIYAGEERISP